MATAGFATISAMYLPRAIGEGRATGVGLALLGVLLFVLGPVLYFAQMQIPRFDMPWYLPILSTLGAIFS